MRGPPEEEKESPPWHRGLKATVQIKDQESLRAGPPLGAGTCFRMRSSSDCVMRATPAMAPGAARPANNQSLLKKTPTRLERFSPKEMRYRPLYPPAQSGRQRAGGGNTLLRHNT